MAKARIAAEIIRHSQAGRNLDRHARITTKNCIARHHIKHQVNRQAGIARYDLGCQAKPAGQMENRAEIASPPRPAHMGVLPRAGRESPGLRNGRPPHANPSQDRGYRTDQPYSCPSTATVPLV
jgi:hypothetical protein